MRTFARVLILMAALLPTGCGEGGEGTDPPDVEVTGVTLDRSTLTMTVGGNALLVATVAPADAPVRGVKWSSSAERVATVSDDGAVTAVSVGEATITVTTDRGAHKATCRVTVRTATVGVTGVRITQPMSAIAVGEEVTLTASVSPANATDKNFSWQSENPTIATIDAAGRVKGVSVGRAVLSVTTRDGARTATCNMTVTAPDPLNILSASFIPDPVFLDYCRRQLTRWDTNDDGKLYADEAARVTSIDVANAYGTAISSLRGIEHFTGITYLDCSLNNLSELDVSRCTRLAELYCNNNSRLERLVLADVSRLTFLNCSSCMLSELNLRGCTRLVDLTCFFNELRSIDLSQCTALSSLDVDRNQLTELDLGRNRALTGLICSNNRLTALNLGVCPELASLDVDGNLLSSLDVSRNGELVFLNCNRNSLTQLDVSRNPRLESLICDANLLASITIGPSNERLEFVRNSSNRLSADALNDIFTSLPYSGTIALSDNPGTTTCDIGLAESKNWIVQAD